MGSLVLGKGAVFFVLGIARILMASTDLSQREKGVVW